MPTWRKLHVKATESLDINDMPDDFHRLLWVMLPLGLDKCGVGLDNPAWIKSRIMPLRLDVTYEMIEAAMGWYESRGMILRYLVKDRAYFWLKSFLDHQGNLERESESNYPPPPDLLKSNARVTHDSYMSNTRVSHESLMQESCLDVDVDVDVDVEEEVEVATTGVVKVYEQEIGPITPMTYDQLKDLVEDHSAQWVIAAMREASANGKRSLAYFRAILQRWKVEGYGSGMGEKRQGNGKDPPVNPLLEAVRRRRKEQGDGRS